MSITITGDILYVQTCVYIYIYIHTCVCVCVCLAPARAAGDTLYFSHLIWRAIPCVCVWRTGAEPRPNGSSFLHAIPGTWHSYALKSIFTSCPALCFFIVSPACRRSQLFVPSQNVCVCVCSSTYGHVCIHAYMHTCIRHRFVRTYIKTYIHTYRQTPRRRHRQRQRQTERVWVGPRARGPPGPHTLRKQASKQESVRTQVHAYIHTHTHTCIQACIHTYPSRMRQCT